MHKRLIIRLLFFAGALYQHSFAGIQFSNRDSTIVVGSSRFFVKQPITDWTGTLEQTGSVFGNAISFNNGILDTNNTPALATCTYIGNPARQITLNSQQSIRSDAGTFLPNMSVIRGGNTLQGAPLFAASPAITLASNLSQLTLAVNTKLGTNITMNGGSIILGNDLDIGDGNTLTGSGFVFFNKKRLSFGGADITQTHTITYIDASDIVLYAKTSLYGQWIFGSSGTLQETHITGNGNILDLTSGGTIWVKANVKLYLTDIKIKGLGTGWFVFENQGSQIILENAEIEMDRNYTVTQGGMYVNGQTVITTKSNILTFANNSTLTVDGVTLWYDTTTSMNRFNIQPSVGATNYSNMPNGKNIATINAGRIASPTDVNATATTQCCTNNSNSIIQLTNLLRTTSNLVVVDDILLKQTSEALVYTNRVNSNAIVNLSNQVRTNSNANAYCCRVNSNAIVNLSNRVTNNSNAIVYLSNHSNANNSALLIQTSNAVVSLSQCCKNNSNAIVAQHCCTIADAPLTSDVVMKCNCDIAPIKAINVQNNLTIDGQGAWIEFDEASHPQFVVAADTTVTLSNVSLLRVNGTTFSLGTNATIAISGLVVIEVSDDVTFTTENIVMLGTATNPSILIIRSPDNSRVFTIQPIVVGGVIQKTWNIGINTLEIQNLHLVGVESIAATSVVTPGGLLVGQVALGGNATVDVKQDTDLSFGVEHINNTMRLLANNLTLNNFLLYSPFFESALHMQFSLSSLMLGNPQVNFADNLLFLSGVNGQAELVFDDYWAVVFNQGVNSFDADVNSFISGRNLEIQNFPIKQSSSDLILDSTLVLHTTLPNAIDSSFVKAPELSRAPGRPKIITALSMMYEQVLKRSELKLQNEYARLEKKRKEKEKLTQQAQIEAQKPKPQKPAHKRPHKSNKKEYVLRDEYDVALAQEDEACQNEDILSDMQDMKVFQTPDRSFPLPPSKITLKVTGPSVDLSQAEGTIVVSNGTINKFGADPTLLLNLYMLGDATLIQADPPVKKSIGPMTRAVPNSHLKKLTTQNTQVFVQSDTNKIYVKQDSEINRTGFNFNTLLTSQTVLDFIFNGSTFAPDLLFIPTDLSTKTPTPNHITLPDNSRVEFTGKGTLWIAPDFTAVLQPTISSIHSNPRTTLAFSDGAKVKFNRTTSSTNPRAFSAPFALGQQVTIKGTGAVTIDTGAQVLVETGQRLDIGQAHPKTNIALTVDRLGVLSVDTSVQEINALVKALSVPTSISFHNGTYSISLNEGALFNIGCSAQAEINWDSTNNAPEQSGILTSFAIKNRAVLTIYQTGRLVMGRNLPITGSGSNFGLGGKFLFDPFGGLITGNGIVALGISGFEGVIQPINAQPEYVTAQGFVRSLINTVPALTFATVFRDSKGNQKLFNAGFTTDPVTGAITLINSSAGAVIDPTVARLFISLLPGDEIIGDDPNTGNVFGFNNGSRFTILPSGQRINN